MPSVHARNPAMPPSSLPAIYLGRHGPLSRGTLPRELSGWVWARPARIRPDAPEPEALSAAAPPEAPKIWCEVDTGEARLVLREDPVRAIGAQISTNAAKAAQDVLLTQLACGAVLATDGPALADIATGTATGDLRVHLSPANTASFLSRFAQNTLDAGARAHCFCTGTILQTPRGPIAVEDMRVGFPVRTLDAGVQPVRWIGTTLHTKPRTQAPIEISPGALGKGFPATTLRVSPQHRLCLRSAIAERMFGTPEVLLAARFLLDVPGVNQADGDIPIRYWHIATARHNLVCANGTWVETLFPGLSVPQGMNASDVSALEVVFEQMLARGKDETADALPPVRPILRRAAQRNFVARHLKQRRAFITERMDIGNDDDPRHVSLG